MEKRIKRLGVFMVLCFVALFIQLNNIQVIKANSLANSQDNPRVIAVARSPPRGAIISADGVTLASSVATPQAVDKYKRVYNPNSATLFSQIVGFDSPIYGHTTGVEGQYNSYLESHTRPARTLRDLLVNRTTTDNVTLTIGTQLQSEVAQAVLATNARGIAPEAAAAVIDPKTGAILAMYGNPTFDPRPLVDPNGNVERYYWTSLNPQSDQSPLVSRAFQLGFSPGSTFKTVTSSAVYDHQPALTKVNYPVAGCIPLPQSDKQLCNYGLGAEKCGGTIQQTLPASCNTAFAQMGMSLGATSLTTEAQAFGFNQNIPIDLPGTATGYFPPDQPGAQYSLYNNAPSQAYSSIGQDNVNATALQMALVAAGLANQGVIMTPHVMEQIRDSQGNLVTAYKPKPWLTATSAFTAAAVTSLMQAVVTKGTAAPSASFSGFPASWNVAAKTGTAETTNASGQALTNDWMIAFAPANDPKVAVAVVVPFQPADQTGASTSGPPMKTILGDALGETP
jgi:peptidoglycan glycosyltransferase